ncbi:ORF56 [Betabaculovirus altermyunipunctae]|uniref:ORF56 n=1 Tax=Betabaculovirus altermyunipunctae TaxID=3051996 RepID=A0A1S5YDY1_9BBAC|nr:ORF56 [Betabaculovirus altermyunipunctae]AQQ80323.1 ORF56 [Betabaculovirus altermyunipunctae]
MNNISLYTSWALMVVVIVVVVVFAFRRAAESSPCHPDTNTAADPDSCVAYYDCATRQRRLCPPNECYDKKLGMCTNMCYHCQVELCSKLDANWGNIPVENNCTMYLFCVHQGAALVGHTCNAGQCYNVSANQCTSAIDLCDCRNNEFDSV